MSSELSLFQEFNIQEPTVQNFAQLKCYQGLSLETVEKLEEYVTDAKHIINKASFDLAEIFCNGRRLYRHNKHGGFEGWIEERFKIGRRTAYNMIWRYEQFGTVQNFEQLDIVLSAQYFLSQPATPQEARDEAIQRAESGEKITTSLADDIIERHKAKAEAERLRADHAEQKLEATQRELQDFRDHSKLRERNREQIHVSQILAFKESEDKLKLERDEASQKLKTLQEQTANGLMSPETKEQLEKLQAEIDERTKQRDNLAQLREKLSKELDEQRDANKARHEQEMYEHRINDRVKKITEEWGKCSVTLLGQLPSPIESQVVTGNNWALLDHAADMAQKIIDAVKQAKISKDAVFLNSEVESNAL